LFDNKVIVQTEQIPAILKQHIWKMTVYIAGTQKKLIYLEHHVEKLESSPHMHASFLPTDTPEHMPT